MTLSQTLIAAAALSPALTLAASLRLLVPAYFYPGEDAGGWAALADAAARVPVTAVLNPDSGPGAAPDAEYLAAVNALRAAGGQVIGYVATGYGERPLHEVIAEIETYRTRYPLDGWFLDEMADTATPELLAYYGEVRDHVRQVDPGALLVGNPGTATDPAYAALADVLVTFEDDAGEPGATPDWARNRPAQAFGHLYYQESGEAAMLARLRAAEARNVGWVYVTDDAEPNPWDRLPDYWEAEVAEVGRLNAVPLPAAGGLLAAGLVLLGTWRRPTVRRRA